MRCARSSSGVRDNGHPRDARGFAAADGERSDVDVEAAKQRGDARKNSGGVLHQHDECVQHAACPYRSIAVSTSGLSEGRRIISCSAAPLGIMG